METVSERGGASAPIDHALLAAATRAAMTDALAAEQPAHAIAAALAGLHEGVGGIFPSVFVLEHGRLWLVAQRGYAVVPDGIQIERGIMGRAARTECGQFVPDVRTDPDYVEGLPGVCSEISIPLVANGVVVGVFNLESERHLPEGALEALEPLVAVLAPRADALRSATTLDLSALARLFVYLGSLRDPGEIAELTAASLSRVLPLEVSQVWTWDVLEGVVELGSWRAERSTLARLSAPELEDLRARVDPTVVCQLLEGRGRRGRGSTLVWLPLRANASEIGALVGSAPGTAPVDPTQLDSAALLAAHAAASLDAALALRRERRSAETDPLTGILNRRGLEQRLERALASAQERRVPLSLIVFDCDDFKDVNDRAGHEFGDALLREVGAVLARSVHGDAEVARLGGDEFVVMLPVAGVEEAEAVAAEIRAVLAAGLTDAGFPLRLSAGVSTYPFDGAGPSTLLRSADQALYAAKNGGRDRVAAFRTIVRPDQAAAVDAVTVASSAEPRVRAGRRDGSVLADAIAAAKAIDEEQTVDSVLERLCKSLVFVVGATACSASQVAGAFLVDASEHALREVWLGEEAAYRIADFPLTEEALRTGEPRTVSFLDDVDPAEAFILRELDMNAMLMLPLHVGGKAWGLIELYEMRLRRFSDDDISIAEFLTTQAARRLEVVSASQGPRARPPVYKLPPGPRGAPRAR